MENRIGPVKVSTFEIPTESPESDGTIEWHSTTMVLVELSAGGATGLGFTYASRSAGTLIEEKLASLVEGRDAMDIGGIWDSMGMAVRNVGRPGIASMAISALDIALWDLKARLLNLPLVRLLGQVRPGIAAYGSGGFTSYDLRQLERQLRGWAREGLAAVKMKIGREPKKDAIRVRAAREAIGREIELFVDANGAYGPKEALAHAEDFAGQGVTWFEEPVSSDDLEGLRLLKERTPAGMRVAAGEYGFDAGYFRRMLQARAVDVLQADVTRCGGITGFLQAGALCDAFHVPLSAHTAPSIHQHVGCATSRALNVEYFFDHYRIEQMFFDGAPKPVQGALRPDLSRPGLGLELKRVEAQKYLVK
jgi:L-alanine-DL-glutamate epimerase-like enolase superfamily enzyme